MCIRDRECAFPTKACVVPVGWNLPIVRSILPSLLGKAADDLGTNRATVMVVSELPYIKPMLSDCGRVSVPDYVQKVVWIMGEAFEHILQAAAQRQLALFSSQSPFSIQKRHPYGENLNSDTPGGSKKASYIVEILRDSMIQQIKKASGINRMSRITGQVQSVVGLVVRCVDGLVGG